MLQDSDSLVDDCGIQNESTVHVVPKYGTKVISVFSSDGRQKLSLNVTPNEVVLCLKARLSVKIHKNPSELLLTINEREMLETLPLTTYETDNTLAMITLTVTTTVFIKSSSGSTTEFKICPSKSIKDLKQQIRIREEQKLEPCRQQLFYSDNDRCELLEDDRTITSYNLSGSPLIHLCRDDYLDQLEDECLYSEEPIIWSRHGVEICSLVPIPDDQEVKVGVNIYDASKSEFSFPEGFSTNSHVYQIKVATTDKSLISVLRVTLTNFLQPQGNKCLTILEAAGNPTKWKANLTPEFSFSQVEESRFQHQGREVKITIRSTTCYLVMASCDDFLYQLEDTRLYPGQPIHWNHHGIEIRSKVPFPHDQEVKVGVNIYNASKPEFSFPEGFSIKSYVYQIRVATAHESLISRVQVILTNFPQPQNNECLCLLEAPGRWAGSATPVFIFSQVEASRLQVHERAVEVTVKSTTSYLVVAVLIRPPTQSLRKRATNWFLSRREPSTSQPPNPTSQRTKNSQSQAIQQPGSLDHRLSDHEEQIPSSPSQSPDDRDSPEYQTMIACTPRITSSLAMDPLSVSEHLLAKGLISPNLHEHLVYSSNIPRDKARQLLASVTACVNANPSNFDMFITVLKEQGDWTRDIVSILMETYVKKRF